MLSPHSRALQRHRALAENNILVEASKQLECCPYYLGAVEQHPELIALLRCRTAVRSNCNHRNTLAFQHGTHKHINNDCAVLD
jgi:hypothetical protein